MTKAEKEQHQKELAVALDEQKAEARRKSRMAEKAKKRLKKLKQPQKKQNNRVC